MAAEDGPKRYPIPLIAREVLAGLVEPGTDDARCQRCGAQALLYTLDAYDEQRFTCLDHHGIVVAEVLRGRYDDERAPLPPLG